MLELAPRARSCRASVYPTYVYHRQNTQHTIRRQIDLARGDAITFLGSVSLRADLRCMCSRGLVRSARRGMSFHHGMRERRPAQGSIGRGAVSQETADWMRCSIFLPKGRQPSKNSPMR